MNFAVRVPVTEQSLVAEARRAAVTLAARLGFSTEETGKLSIVATELATNLLKHARGGEMIIRSLEEGPSAGVELIAIDKGPGMANAAECMRDGYSTTGGPGTGLGAISRLSGSFDIFSQKGRGTVITARSWGGTAYSGIRSTRMEVEGFSVAKPGEPVSGDAWAVLNTAAGCRILVVDGLGHGMYAADAARAAVQAFSGTLHLDLPEQFDRIHSALRGTRGAAAAIAAIDLESKQVNYTGVGNIAACIHHAHKIQHLVSMNGIVGHQAHAIREFHYPWHEGAVLIISSDGLSSRWDSSTEAGLFKRPASLIAGVLYRDLNRGRDDATIVVARERRAG